MAANPELFARVHPPRQGRAFARPRTLGFLADSYTDVYQTGLLAGAMRAARDRKANLVAFAGRVPTHETPDDALASDRSVEALIVTAPTMAYRLGLDGLGRYARALGALPLCFIGAKVQGIPAVLSDNRGGMEQAVRHLVRVHGRRNIAFVRGTPGNAEAEERLLAYRTVLAENSIEYREALVRAGDFMRHSGIRAMREILDGGASPDGVVAANDMMALGAMDVLRERGIAVPRDVSVAGFDDIEEGQFATPTLTSVCQPLESQGREAVKLMMDALTGSPPSRDAVVSLELMVRASCGCEGEASGLSGRSRAGETGALEPRLLQRRQLIVAEMARAAQASLGRLGQGWAERLLQALVDDLRGLRTRGFIKLLEETLAASRATGGRLVLWQRVISVLRAEVRAAAGTDADRLGAAEDLLHEAREIIAREMQHQQAMLRMSAAHWVRAMRESGIALGAVRGLDDVVSVLVEHLERLGFRRAYVAVEGAAPGRSRLLLGWDRDLPLESVAPPEFDTLDLTPDHLMSPDEAGFSVVLPLTRGERRLGHVVLDAGAGEALVWEGLCQQLSMALELCCARELAAPRRV